MSGADLYDEPVTVTVRLQALMPSLAPTERARVAPRVLDDPLSAATTVESQVGLAATHAVQDRRVGDGRRQERA